MNEHASTRKPRSNEHNVHSEFSGFKRIAPKSASSSLFEPEFCLSLNWRHYDDARQPKIFYLTEQARRIPGVGIVSAVISPS
jgi:hypothetical protein